MKRYEYLKRLIKQNDWKIGAEIGVAVGKTSQFLLSTTKVHLIMVDPWKPTPFYSARGWDALRHLNHKKQALRAVAPYKQRTTIIAKTSEEASQEITDGSLDFAFIDGDHSYEAVCLDINLWKPKIRSGGWLLGHDWHFKGVKRAVDELLPQAIFTTMDHVWYEVVP